MDLVQVSVDVVDVEAGYEGRVMNFRTREVLARKTFAYPQPARDWAHVEKLKFRQD